MENKHCIKDATHAGMIDTKTNGNGVRGPRKFFSGCNIRTNVQKISPSQQLKKKGNASPAAGEEEAAGAIPTAAEKEAGSGADAATEVEEGKADSVSESAS